MMRTAAIFTWIFIFLHIVTTSSSNGSKKFQKHFGEPLSVTWTVTDLEIVIKIEPNPNWPNVTVEYEVFTKYVIARYSRKEMWRMRPCKPKVSDAFKSNEPYFCALDFANYDQKLNVKARAKWDQLFVNGTRTETVTRHTRKKKADIELDVFKQSGFTAPVLDNVVANDNSVVFDISIPASEATCWLRKFEYHFAAVDITDEENFDCSGNFSIVNSSVATGTKDHRIIFFPKTVRVAQLIECEKSVTYSQSINLHGLQPERKYCLQANYEHCYEGEGSNFTIKSQFIYHQFETIEKEQLKKFWLLPIFLSVYATALVFYYIHWTRKRQRKMNKTKKEFYEDQKSLLERDNMYSSVKGSDLTNEEPEADMIPSAHQTEEVSETENFELQVVDRSNEKNLEINPVKVGEENATKVEEESSNNHPKPCLIDSGMESFDDTSRNSSICSYHNDQQQISHQHIPSPGGYVEKESFNHKEVDKDSGGCGLDETSFTNTHYVDRTLLS